MKAFIIFLMIFPFVCYSQQPKLINFSISECKHYCQIEPGIISDTFKDGVYSIKVGAELICCAEFIGEFEILNKNRINLKAKVKPESESCECDCYYELLYEISGLKEKPTSILLNGKLKNDTSLCSNNIYILADKLPIQNSNTDTLLKLINSTINIPQTLDGTIAIKFVINCKGIPVKFEVIESIDSKIEIQLIDIIKTNTSWEPAILKGINVDCYKFYFFKVEKSEIKIKQKDR